MNKTLARAAAVIALGMAVQFALGADGPAAPDAPAAAKEAPAPAQPAVTLHVGDVAPALAPSKWLKGDAVDKFEPGKLYIVEFWATWCGPCRESIPHLSELQKQYPDITFIGQDCMEQDQSGVPDFVQKMGDKMSYRVALDDANNKMAKTWMDAAGQDGIPTAFVVGKDSKIAWIGHPMELGDILKQVVAGTFDSKKAAAEAAAQQQFQADLGKAIQACDVAAIDKLYKAQPGMADAVTPGKYLLNQLAWSMVDPEHASEHPDLDLALKAANAANDAAKGQEGQILDTLARVYFVRGDLDKAIETQTKAVDKAQQDFRADVAKTLAEYKAKKDAGK